MSEQNMEEKVDSTSESKVEETKVESTTQDPLKKELERVNTTGKSEKEKAAYSLKKNADRFRELGGNPDEVLGNTRKEEEGDDAPVTLGMLRKMQAQNTTKSAMQMAEEIANETERELTKYHVQNTIRSTGNPSEDLRLARALVNSVKNSQIMQENARRTEVKTYSNGSGAPARETDDRKVDLNSQDMEIMRAFGLSKEEALNPKPKFAKKQF